MGFNDFLKKHVPVPFYESRLNGYAMGGMILKDKSIPIQMPKDIPLSAGARHLGEVRDKVYPTPLHPNPRNVLQPAFVRDSIH